MLYCLMFTARNLNHHVMLRTSASGGSWLTLPLLGQPVLVIIIIVITSIMSIIVTLSATAFEK